MKTTKLFFMAALALMTAACSNDDNDLTQQPAKAEGIPFTATISISQSASTRALTENGTKIEATWATGEKVALIYTVSATTYVKEAEVTPQGDGTATISTTLEGSPADNTDVTIVYPASAVDETTKDVKTNLLASQNGLLTGTGSISEKYELRKTTTPAKLKIDGTTASLKGTVSLTNQNAIFKLTLKDIDGTSDVSANSVIISDENGVVTTVMPAPGYENAMYVALPTTATILKFLVTGSDSKKYFNMASNLTLSASYYQSTIKLATVGNFIASNGKCYKDNSAIPSGESAVAKIAYLGNDAETSPTNTAFKNGLALALEDVSDAETWCSQTSATCLGTQYDSDTEFNDLAGIANTDALVNHTGHTHAAASAARGYNSGHPTGTSAWFLPSAGQWNKMANAAGGYATLKTNAGLQEGYANYWSSTEFFADYAWYWRSSNFNWYKDKKGIEGRVRACLAF